MTGPTPDDLDDLVSAARAEARARVHAELVERFVDEYRRELSRRPALAPVPDDPPRPDVAARPAATHTAAGAPSSHDTGTSGAPDRVWYLYGLVRAEEAGRLADLDGIDGTPVRVVADGPVAALAGELPLAPFQAAQAAPDLSEDGWLARALRAHDRVGGAAFDTVSLLPLRFGSLYPERAAVAAMLRDRREPILAELDRLAGAGEWSVKVLAASAADAVPEPEPAGQPSDGTAWMNRQLEAAIVRDRTQRHREALVTDLDERLSARARDRYPREAAGRDGQRALFSVVYLVDDAAGDRFRGELRDFGDGHADDDLRLVVHGPGPAYHFVRWEAPHG